MEGVAGIVPVAAPLVLALMLAGCAADEATTPLIGQESSTKLSATTSGTAEVGSFEADAGDLWVGGRCSGGDLEVRVDPVAVLPIPCESLGGEPFMNQIVMARPTTVTVSVSASAAVTWDLRVQQE